jgi:hypothetical protein
MKNIVIISVLLLFYSCNKDNDFEDVTLENRYANEVVDFVTIDNSELLSCNVVKLFFSVKNENLPDSITYTHVLFKKEINTAVKIPKNNESVILNINCDTPTTFFITLYNEDLNKESNTSMYTYNP